MNSIKLAVITGCVLLVFAVCLLFNTDPFHVFALLAFIFALDVQIVQAVKATLEKERQKRAEEFLKNLKSKLGASDDKEA